MGDYVTSKITLNMPNINRLTTNAVKALEQTTDALLTEVKNSQRMPFKDGTLQNEDTFADYSQSSKGYTKIISSTPYARRLYYHPEYNFSTIENKNAGGKWFDPWLEGGEHQEFCPKTFKEIYRRLCGL